jgi:hypothetical protein
MVSFDLKVVAENATSGGYFRSPISYNRGNNTCTLTCHNFSHNADGTVTPAAGPKAPATGKR